SNAVVTIVDTVETNDTTPEFSGTSKNVEGDLVVSVGGATYHVTPDTNGNWTLDTETATPVSGTLDLNVDGTYTIVVNATGTNGHDMRPANDSFILDTQTDAVVTLVDTTTISDITPLFNGTATNTEGPLVIEVGGATYHVIPNAENKWSLDTETAVPVSGTFSLASDGTYTITVDAEDADGNAIEQISDDFKVATDPDDDSNAVVTIVDTVETNDTTPEFSGTSKNVEGDLVVSVGGATYHVTPDT
ncbi:MAG: hypothetical protein GY937_05930, partial [bacterium]|nr:hypothetical protein [bacterium]